MAKGKIKVAVLMGGPSSEHEVSLNTGKMILKNLDKEKFKTMPLKIEKDGAWPITIEKLKRVIDIAFIAIHGEYGEDGQVQSLLETFRIPYTGSNPISSAIAINKYKTTVLLSANNLLTPKSLVINNGNSYNDWAILKNFQNPVVIKPADRGSSVGMSIINKKEGVQLALSKAFQYSDAVLAQEYVRGREITCGVLEINKHPIALIPTEIFPKSEDFFDYHAKYNTDGAVEITPPKMPKETIRKIQETALKVHKLIDCSGMSRTDMILQKSGNLCILEINTIPGMTKTSLLPQQAEKVGIKFPQLLEIIIRSGLSR